MYPLKEINTIKDCLVPGQQTIAVAESVTSGHLQAAFSLAEDARKFYQGGITTYNLGQKCAHLKIEPIHAINCDCVSEIVSQQMALNVASLFRSNYGIGITGYAATVPEKNIRDLFAYFSICRDGRLLLTQKLMAPEKEVLEVQLFYMRAVIKELQAILTEPVL
jgi:nicotinamide-nucleotide amidase